MRYPDKDAVILMTVFFTLCMAVNFSMLFVFTELAQTAYALHIVEDNPQ